MKKFCASKVFSWDPRAVEILQRRRGKCIAYTAEKISGQLARNVVHPLPGTAEASFPRLCLSLDYRVVDRVDLIVGLAQGTIHADLSLPHRKGRLGVL